MRKILLTAAFIFSVCFVFAQDSTFYFTTSDNVKLYVRMAGKGAPCLFVHGGPGSTSYYYEAMAGAPVIEEALQMIYFDQRGSGRSDSARNGNYSLQRLQQDMEELRIGLGFKQWAVMGHSFGGILITNYAYHYPAAVASLLLINCTLDLNASMNSHLQFGLQELAVKDKAPYLDSTKPLNERVWKIHEQLGQKDIWYKLMYRNAYEKKYNDSVTLSVGKLNRHMANSVWGKAEFWQDFTPLTKKVTCPVLIITGRKDYAVGPEQYQRFAFPNKTVVQYNGGHAPFQEEPNWYAEKVMQFVQHSMQSMAKGFETF